MCPLNGFLLLILSFAEHAKRWRKKKSKSKARRLQGGKRLGDSRFVSSVSKFERERGPLPVWLLAKLCPPHEGTHAYAMGPFGRILYGLSSKQGLLASILCAPFQRPPEMRICFVFFNYLLKVPLSSAFDPQDTSFCISSRRDIVFKIENLSLYRSRARSAA